MLCSIRSVGRTQCCDCFLLGCQHSQVLTYISCTLPKVKFPQQLSDLRPISLCNVSSKIFSKILYTTLALVLPKIISVNRFGLCKCQTNFENILFAQEIIDDFDREQKGGNSVMKFEMAKVYDRVTWPFLSQVMRGLGFSEAWVQMVLSFQPSNEKIGFFRSMGTNGVETNLMQLVFYHCKCSEAWLLKSTNGLRQGDPGPPSLFVISFQLLFSMLNKLLTKKGFASFLMHMKGPLVSHLSFANDMILFVSGKFGTIKLIMKTLELYESTSKF